MENKFFRVKIGYGITDFISIDETELPMAMRAMITGKIGIFKEGSVSGKAIIAIIPDWQRVMGLNRDYVLQGEDYEKIGTKKLNEYKNFISDINFKVENQLGNGMDKKLLN